MNEREMLVILNRPKGFKALQTIQLIFGGVLVLCAVMLIISAFR
jgi:hypothetical protein